MDKRISYVLDLTPSYTHHQFNIYWTRVSRFIIVEVIANKVILIQATKKMDPRRCVNQCHPSSLPQFHRW